MLTLQLPDTLNLHLVVRETCIYLSVSWLLSPSETEATELESFASFITGTMLLPKVLCGNQINTDRVVFLYCR